MKRLVYLSMIAVMALCAVSCKKHEDPVKTGFTADYPYTTKEAREAVSGLSWTSNAEYETTGVVYVKGRITKITDYGHFQDSGTFGNATFYIASDATPGYVLYCYRILYLKGQKYVTGPDIEEGDTVIICGKLMNYKGNTPETVALEAHLFALN